MADLRLSPEQDQLLCSELLRMAAAEQPLSVRALYYRAVVNPALPFITKDSGNARRNERLVQSRVLALRRDGQLPWHWIVDPSRSSYSVPRWSSPAAFAEMAAAYYDRDFWAEQSTRPLVVVEKVAALGTVLNHCRRNGVDVVASKGYGSASQLADVAEDLLHSLEDGQLVTVLVLADFDPSGCDWPRAAEVELRRHIHRLGGEPDLLTFERLLLTAEQAAGLGQQVALRPPSAKDARTVGFLERFGFAAGDESCVELDAMPPTEIRRLLSEQFDALHEGSLSQELEQQIAERGRITAALADLQQEVA